VINGTFLYRLAVRWSFLYVLSLHKVRSVYNFLARIELAGFAG